MGHSQLPSDECLPFVDPPQQHVAEEDGPDAIVDLVEADAVLLQRRRHIQQAGFETDGASVG